MRAALVPVAALALFVGLAAGPPPLRLGEARRSPGEGGQPPSAKTLDLYLIDVEGGNAQLYRLPSGE